MNDTNEEADAAKNKRCLPRRSDEAEQQAEEHAQQDPQESGRKDEPPPDPVLMLFRHGACLHRLL
ncbi:hypothetical protein ACFVYR_20860 [Streptomyces sp. NPDC058284]|uniref:hypothetical protein n=1 Tax=Streptomyces sp. NPDC058284 TaxID=3346421 RepID=UPI0036E31296